jgi:arylsulfatase A-like enzyme
VALLVVAAVAGCSGPAAPVPSDSPPRTTIGTPASTGPKPNIVLVLADDLSTDLLPYLPNVQALQRRGMTFSSYFVTDSLCCPSRASILTGGYPHTTGVFTNGGEDGGWPVFRANGGEEQTFAKALHDTGYRTAMIGKYLNGYQKPSEVAGPIPPGWDEWSVVGGVGGYGGYDYWLNVNGTNEFHGRKESDYFTDVLSRRAVSFLRGTGSAPFFMEVAPFAPHHPFTPPKRHEKAFPRLTMPRTAAYNHAARPTDPQWLQKIPALTAADGRTIDAEFRERARAALGVDDLVGRITKVLGEQGVLDETYIVFSSDNGFHLGERRMRRGKETPYDHDVRVPLVVAGPGVRPGSTTDLLTENVDLAPTFTELGGAAQPAFVNGRSLVPLLRGETPAAWRSAVLVEHHFAKSPAQKGPDRESFVTPPDYTALRFPTALYVEYATGEVEYHDMTSDPLQLHNTVADLDPQVRQALHGSLAALAGCVGADGCWQAATRATQTPGS